MWILTPINLCKYNEGQVLNFHLKYLDVEKKRGKVPKSFLPQLPLTVGQSALDIKHCTVCIHLISSFSGEKVSTTLLTNSWARTCDMT